MKTLLVTWTLRLPVPKRHITAVQMDMKLHGLPVSVLAEAIRASTPGRKAYSRFMLTTLAAPKPNLSPYAPRIEKD